MTTQRTPDALSIERQNEAICEKLLGWKRATSMLVVKPDFIWMDGHVRRKTPRFITWAEAGPLLQALRAKCAIDIHSKTGGGWLLVPSRRNPDQLGFLRIGDYMGDELPPLIRAAALEYIKAVKS